MSVKWQIPIGESVLTPFERKMYSVGLISIVIHNRETTKKSELLHICMQPNPMDGDLWLGGSGVLYCIKSFGVGRAKKDVVLNWGGSDIEFYRLDLSPQTMYIKAAVVNNDGVDIGATGFCLFDVRE